VMFRLGSCHKDLNSDTSAGGRVWDSNEKLDEKTG
jgi:hypothetical protein